MAFPPETAVEALTRATAGTVTMGKVVSFIVRISVEMFSPSLSIYVTLSVKTDLLFS